MDTEPQADNSSSGQPRVDRDAIYPKVSDAHDRSSPVLDHGDDTKTDEKASLVAGIISRLTQFSVRVLIAGVIGALLGGIGAFRSDRSADTYGGLSYLDVYGAPLILVALVVAWVVTRSHVVWLLPLTISLVFSVLFGKEAADSFVRDPELYTQFAPSMVVGALFFVAVYSVLSPLNQFMKSRSILLSEPGKITLISNLVILVVAVVFILIGRAVIQRQVLS